MPEHHCANHVTPLAAPSVVSRKRVQQVPEQVPVLARMTMWVGTQVLLVPALVLLEPRLVLALVLEAVGHRAPPTTLVQRHVVRQQNPSENHVQAQRRRCRPTTVSHQRWHPLAQRCFVQVPTLHSTWPHSARRLAPHLAAAETPVRQHRW